MPSDNISFVPVASLQQFCLHVILSNVVTVRIGTDQRTLPIPLHISPLALIDIISAAGWDWTSLSTIWQLHLRYIPFFEYSYLLN